MEILDAWFAAVQAAADPVDICCRYLAQMDRDPHCPPEDKAVICAYIAGWEMARRGYWKEETVCST